MFVYFPLQIVLTYNTTINQSRVVWTEPGLGNDTQSSYLMCQMNWHSVRVIKQSPNVTITLDELHSVSSPMRHGTNMTGELFLGGYPGKISTDNGQEIQSVLLMLAPFSSFDKKKLLQFNVEIRTNYKILVPQQEHGEMGVLHGLLWSFKVSCRFK